MKKLLLFVALVPLTGCIGPAQLSQHLLQPNMTYVVKGFNVTASMTGAGNVTAQEFFALGSNWDGKTWPAGLSDTNFVTGTIINTQGVPAQTGQFLRLPPRQ